MATRWTIYLLRDPEQPVGYVGQTRARLRHRLNGHMRQARYDAARRPTRERAVCVWLGGLLARGLVPSVEALEGCDSLGAANEAERRWIREAPATLGLTLVNATQGGQRDYGPEHGAAVARKRRAPEARARAAVDTAATWLDPDVRRRRSEGIRATASEPEQVARRSRHSSRVTREKWADSDSRARRLAGMKGKAHPRMSERWADPEYRARVSARISEAFRRRRGEGA